MLERAVLMMCWLHCMRRGSDDLPLRLCRLSVAALDETCDFPEDDLDAVFRQYPKLQQ
jgi:hypothetical protein